MASQSTLKPAHLEPSQLSTKEYWDKLYSTEISNHDSDPSDVGTIWFDDSSAEDKILSFLHSPRLGLDPSQASFLDIGTGNGHFLFRLREGEDDTDTGEDDTDTGEDDTDTGEDDDDEEEDRKDNKKDLLGSTGRNGGFSGRILGIDYSPKSIEFAQRLAHEKSPNHTIEFLLFDIMNSTPSGTALLSPPNADGWDVVLDKGTFDAISLSGEIDPAGRRLCEGYRDKIVPLVKHGGVFLVTSCNWTEDELRGWFENSELAFEAGIAYRSFRFGGSDGQSVSSVCFRRKRVDGCP